MDQKKAGGGGAEENEERQSCEKLQPESMPSAILFPWKSNHLLCNPVQQLNVHPCELGRIFSFPTLLASL